MPGAWKIPDEGTRGLAPGPRGSALRGNGWRRDGRTFRAVV